MRLSRSRLRESITGPRLVSEGDRVTVETVAGK